jgi:DNA replication protein DnaC
MSEQKKPTVLLEHYLKRLKLPTMLREYASMAAICKEDRSDYPTYLLRLSERELFDRETSAAERRVKDARFPVTKTIDTFDFKAQASINELLVRKLWRGEFIDKRENVLLIGNSGTGETHLACALAFSVCMQGYRVRFSSVWSPNFWSVEKIGPSSASTNNSNANSLWSWTNWGMCRFPR